MDFLWWIKFLKVLAGCVRLSLVSVYMRLVFMMDPGARRRDLEAVTESYNLPEEGLKYIQWRNERTVARFFYTWNMIKDHFKTQMQDINKLAELYGSAPDPILHEPGTGGQVRLLSVASRGRPLVINFGSCTWPPFMVNLARIKAIQARFTRATFLTIYTQEAHPTEAGDYIDYFLPINKHKSLEGRLSAANELLTLETLPGPLLVDNMDNEASRAFGSFPDRLYILLEGKIVYMGGVGPHGYNTFEVEEWLEKYFT